MYCVDTKELKKAMVDADLDSIQKLADASGVSRNTVVDVVSGRIQPSTDVMRKLAGALELPSERAGLIFFAFRLTSDVSEN